MYRTETLHVEGSPMPVLIFEPPGSGPHPALLAAQHLPVAHAGLERDPFQITVGERYAAAGYVVAMPWFFHWWPADADVAVKRAEFRDDRTVADIRATVDLLCGMTGVDPHRLGILGHCWGGRVAWLGACQEPRLRATAVFYGGRVKTGFADGGPAPITLAHDMRGPLLGIFGNDDSGPSPQDVDDYQAALQAAGIAHEFHRYDGAGHGFQDFTSTERYRETQAEDAWRRALEFFGRHLG